jgi:serine/threonine protein phosphatase 1
MSGLTYAIADLHGRFDLLRKAASLIEADAGGQPHKVIVMGDFVDRGPDSRSIIEFLMLRDWVVLQGNHEDIMLQALAEPLRALRWWIGNGGGATLKSYGYKDRDSLQPLKVPPAHLAWLEGLPLYYEDNWRIFVHAGVPWDAAVADTAKSTLQWMLYPDDQNYSDAEYHDDEPHLSGKHIVHGHHQSASHPLLKPHRTNLDSFAWNTGRLAIGVFNNEQAQPIRVLYAHGVPDWFASNGLY